MCIRDRDKGGNWKDVCWPVTAEFRKQLNDALIDGYGQAIENLQATLEATKGAAEKPSLTGALKENAGKVKEMCIRDRHYPEKRGIVHNEILLPANAPQEYADRNTLDVYKRQP